MDQSSPDLFLRTQEESVWNISFPFLDILSHSGDIRDQSRRLYCIKSTEILHVFGPPFLGGELPEFFKSIYKIDKGSDHVAKFRGDWPRELGDYALKEKKRKKTSRAFYKTSRYYVRAA